MPDGVVGQSVLLIPGRRVAVPVLGLAGLFLLQAGTEQLRPLYPGWDIWVVRCAVMRQTAWCARPKGPPVATINVDSPEELVAAIAEHESRL